jgi:hypothetical protein
MSGTTPEVHASSVSAFLETYASLAHQVQVTEQAHERA